LARKGDNSIAFRRRQAVILFFRSPFLLKLHALKYVGEHIGRGCICGAEVIAVKVERKTCDVELGGETTDRAETERGYTVALTGLETQQGVVIRMSGRGSTCAWRYALRICFFACRPLLVEGQVANSGFATDGTVRYAGHSFDIGGNRVSNANTEEFTERRFTEAKELGVHARSFGNLCGN
jgi:hypothetical protein